MHLVLIVNILPIFRMRGQELKAHLSIEVSNGNATHNSIVSNNVFVCLKVPLGVPCWAKAVLPVVIRTVCFLSIVMLVRYYCHKYNFASLVCKFRYFF